jgi:hypothetical protein
MPKVVLMAEDLVGLMAHPKAASWVDLRVRQMVEQWVE